MPTTVDIIQKKRDGGELSPPEIQFLIDGYMSGSVPDYQMSSWLMAALLKELTFTETLALCDALVDSGDRLELSQLGRRVVDKHSTGGVGDKVTLVLGPVVAACGAVFGKMSGRGLGHTGGTVDKLESIPGYKTEISPEEFISQLMEIGICVAGEAAGLAPADGKLYALRDVTGTVESVGLVAASIMSKKIAGGASAVVLDIKVGRGAFSKNEEHARKLARLMARIGEERGIKVDAVLSSMEQPLGYAVGNALEVMEAVETLKGGGPTDLLQVIKALAQKLLFMSDLEWSPDKAGTEIARVIKDGSALTKFKEWIGRQGGDVSFIETGALPLAPVQAGVFSESDGYVQSIDTYEVGRSVLKLGAGRLKKDDVIDHGVGAMIHAKVGEQVIIGERLATVYARTEESASAAVPALRDCFVISRAEVARLSALI